MKVLGLSRKFTMISENIFSKTIALKQFIVSNSINSYGGMLIIRSHQLRYSGLKAQLPPQRISRLVAFLLSRANRSAITRISANRLTLYTDEPFYEPRWRELMQGIAETGKMGYRMFGSQYERLINELHRLADSRHVAGYEGSTPSRGSTLPANNG